MGDRANVLIKSKGRNEIYFYTHWNGYKLPITVQDALKRGRDRWDDEIYLNRIIFSEMIKDRIMDITGYGISSYVGDGEDRIIHINVEKQQVTLKNQSYTFEKYIALDLKDIDF